MPNVDEKIFFFTGSKNRALLGFLHRPTSTNRSTGIIFCPPFAEEKNMSHSVVVKTARMFAEHGFPVLRFDLSGCGDSEGDFGEATLEDWQEDLSQAVTILFKETDVEHYALWGLRLGAGLALLHTARHKDVSFLILWQPVIDFAEHIQQFLRRKISSQISRKEHDISPMSKMVEQLEGQGVVHVIGYPVTRRLYDGFNAVGKYPYQITPSIPTLLLSISLMERPAFSMKQYSDRLLASGVPVRFKHVTAEPFWDRYWRWECRDVSDFTLKWAKELV